MTAHNQSPHKPGVIALAAALTVLFVCSAASAARMPWHESFDKALAAARESHKPILVFVHLGPMNRKDGSGSDPSYEQMIFNTLVDENVVGAASAFECVELDLRKRSSDDARDKLRVAPVRDELTGRPANAPADALTGIYPITLFLDRNGEESFRLHGYMPPAAYAIQLTKAALVIKYQKAVALAPEDAVARRNLGRIYMEMFGEDTDKFYKAALTNLELAVQLDPDNQTGANYDARVDLAIIHLPDDLEAGFATLFQLQSEDIQRTRRFEIQYYMGVAQYALENAPAAIQILQSFETADRESPYFDNQWTALALALLKHIRGRQ